MKIALAQLDIRWENKPANRKACEALVKKAAAKGTDLIIFPEMTLTGFSMDVRKTGELEKGSETVRWFQSLAKHYGIGIVFGVVFSERGKGKNMAMLVNKSGRIIHRYQKIHPFSYAKEDRSFMGGNTLTSVRYGGLNIVTIVCYDLRFIKLAVKALALKPDLLVCIANWPDKRIRHWRALLQSRALDLQSFVVGVNRIGSGNGLEYSGRSAVFGPEGAPLLDMNDEQIGYGNLDLSTLRSYRKAFPFLKDAGRITL